MKRHNKHLKVILKKHSGRSSSGRITTRGQGGRQKRYYRLIDWQRKKTEAAKVLSIEYDPNRSVNICSIQYADNQLSYILHPADLKVGDQIISGPSVPIKPGNALPLKNIPSGVEIHNIELVVGQGGQIVRSAGASAVIIGKDDWYAHLKLPSGEIRKVNLNCYATIGKLDNESHAGVQLKKAGRARLMGRRPHVRGVAMNPNSHPHGGGEGRSGQGMHPKTPWGKGALGIKTRHKKKASNKLIIKTRKK